MQQLEDQVQSDLKRINIPGKLWVCPVDSSYVTSSLDVAIVGGGMGGNAVGLALFKLGIVNIKIFDSSTAGKEGPWKTYARMKQLRSSKPLQGPALDIPSLTFRSWFEAIYGSETWEIIDFIPTDLWADYLIWYRKVLQLPVENEMKLVKITPLGDFFELTFENNGSFTTYFSRKIVLATGMGGFGGNSLPPYSSNIPKEFYIHTSEPIDPVTIIGKKIGIIGAGASAFDAAAFSLENGAAQVDMIIRREKISLVNRLAQFSYPGIQHGFYTLSDDIRCHILADTLACGIPPPKSAFYRLENQENFYIHLDTEVQKVDSSQSGVTLETNNGSFEFDFIFFATGFAIDGTKTRELADHMANILLWEDVVPSESLRCMPKLGQFPYLGPHFEFLELSPGAAPYLKNIHCFNYGAFLSHGPITSNIDGVSVGASRLAEGIAIDLFIQNR